MRKTIEITKDREIIRKKEIIIEKEITIEKGMHREKKIIIEIIEIDRIIREIIEINMIVNLKEINKGPKDPKEMNNDKSEGLEEKKESNLRKI